MNDSVFTYSIYIRATPQHLWDALTLPPYTKQYWCEIWHATDWKPGSEWKLMIPDGRVGDSGEVVEADPPRRLVLKWRNEFIPELRNEGYSRCDFDIEEVPGAVQLKVTHRMDSPNSQLIAKVSEGWPAILSSLKSLLETGEALQMTARWPKGM